MASDKQNHMRRKGRKSSEHRQVHQNEPEGEEKVQEYPRPDATAEQLPAQGGNEAYTDKVMSANTSEQKIIDADTSIAGEKTVHSSENFSVNPDEIESDQKLDHNTSTLVIGNTFPLDSTEDKKYFSSTPEMADKKSQEFGGSDTFSADVELTVAQGGAGLETNINADKNTSANEVSEAETSPPEASKKKIFGRSHGSAIDATTSAFEQKSEEYISFSPLHVEPQSKATFLSGVFTSFSWLYFIVLTFVFIGMVAFYVYSPRSFWFPDEVRYAAILQQILAGEWLLPQLNGNDYLELPLLFFWLAGGVVKLADFLRLDFISGFEQLLFGVTAVSGLLLLWGLLALARFAANVDRYGAFAAGCVFLSVFSLNISMYLAGPELLFTAFLVWGLLFMFRALQRKTSSLLMGAAFLCFSLAIMTGGIAGLVLPVTSAILFCIWTGKPLRLLNKDFLLGMIFSLLPAIFWLGAIWAEGKAEVVLSFLGHSLAISFVDHDFSFYLLLAAVLWLPWAIVVLFLPWTSLFSKQLRAAVSSSRSGERQGLAFIWLVVASALFVLLAGGGWRQISFVLYAPLAILTGRAVLLLSPVRSAFFQRALATVLLLAMLCCVILPVYFSGSIPAALEWLKIDLPQWQLELRGSYIIAAILLVFACFFLGAINARRPESALLTMLGLALLLSYPLANMLMPSLDKVLSPRMVASKISEFEKSGFKPVAIDLEPEFFTYYTNGLQIEKISTLNSYSNPTDLFSSHIAKVVIVPDKVWDELQHIFAGYEIEEVMDFWLGSIRYRLLLYGVPETSSSVKSGQKLDIFKSGINSESQTNNSITGELDSNIDGNVKDILPRNIDSMILHNGI